MTYERSTQSVPIRPHRRGFTMAEMMVAVTIMVIVTAIVASLFVQVRKMIGLTQWSSETRAELRTVVGTLAQDLANIDPQAYFMMLNRDYGWDTAQPGLVHHTAGGNATSPLLYPDDPPTGNRRFWADRLAFVANGPFNTLQNLQAGGAPVIGTSARVYYGQSLWTHELADTGWTAQGPAGLVPLPLNPFLQQGMPALPGPYQMSAWTGDLAQRPAVGWNLLRQAVLHVPNPAVDYAFPNYLNLTREIDWRAVVDGEFSMVDGSLGLYTPDAIGRQVAAWLTTPGNYNWMSLLWSPRADTGWPADDRTAMARSRVLLPHAARLRFQVRLSDGTVVPQLDEVNDNPGVRGGIISPGYNTAPDYSLPALPWTGATPTFVVVDPTTAMNTAHPAGVPSQPAWQVPLRQTAYIWSTQTTNVPLAAGTTTLYPVAVRIRIEVYDPQRRTPDPIKLDEWLPVRWR